MSFEDVATIDAFSDGTTVMHYRAYFWLQYTEGYKLINNVNARLRWCCEAKVFSVFSSGLAF
ncbi:hypothetical protein KSX_10640 [Ktedonospora formicarum]|uniref:Uncharacterized protein n=1 Tax=Ktedonospora formicarum TaxID=2778364 RepID=A0A8J3HVS2_9CHLR|nr:hypothetical protein KSX_10640 [Ktedonospora formicarum]